MRLIRTSLRAPRGATLVATLVALVIGSIAITLVARAAVAALATEARLARLARLRDDPGDALETIAHRLRDSSPRDGDLLQADGAVLALRARIGTGLVCAQARDTLLLAAGDDAAPWRDAWERAPRAGDVLRTSHDSGRAQSALRRVDAIDQPCAPGARAWSLRARWRVVTADTLPALAIGHAVRVAARERWTLHRGADNAWALGQATWDAALGTWATPQPLVAPMRSPAAGGFRVTAHDSTGAPLPLARLADATLVTLVAHADDAAAPDTMRIHVGAP
ncbi:MAG: hypothetical protein MUF21_00825 [Gemmatimonadaceae bacterium]|nr:hypothetical protein [Gemmatimonadaceae bacterium]